MDKKKKISFPIFITVILVGFIIIGITLYQNYRSQHETLRLLMDSRAKQMENSVMSSLNEAYILRALVLGANGGTVNLDLIGPTLDLGVDTRNVLLAPDGIAAQVYPLEGNEGVLGLDLYSSNNASNDAAKEARQTGELTVTGPYDLVQGGQAISGRIAVWIPMEDGTKKEWGLVSVTIKFPEVMQDTVTDDLESSGYSYRVLKLDNATGKYNDLLEYGFDEMKDFETYDFSIQNMQFRMEAYPSQGWIRYHSIIIQILSAILAALFLSWIISSIVERRRILNEKATKDALTGVYNRDYTKKEITKSIASKKYKEGVFVLLDLDHFKSVNDTLGHQVGDRVLIETAQILLRSFRNTDLVCRLGGDEFIVYMGCDSAESFLPKKINRLCENLERTVTSDGKTVEVSSSIGIAISPQDGMDFDTLYQKADKALYFSKENGRNQYTILGEILEK